MEFNFNVDEQSVKRVIERLRTAVQDALTEKDLDEIAEYGLSIIKLRTMRGNFLEGSKSPAKYSKGHARKRSKLGLQNSKVTLFMGEIGVLEGIKTRTSSNSSRLRIDIGYLDSTEAKAREIGGYLDEEGVGINRVKYRHIGFDKGERKRILKLAQERVDDNVEKL